MMTEQETAIAAEKVLFPELHEASFTLYPDASNRGVETKVTLQLRPLPVKYAKEMARALKKLEPSAVAAAAGKLESGLQQLVDVADVMIDVLMMMLRFYCVAATREVVEDSLGNSEIKGLINKQLKIDEDDDFLLVPWRNIMQGLDQNFNQLSPPPSPPSTPASAQNGAVLSTPSSPDTAVASS